MVKKVEFLQVCLLLALLPAVLSAQEWAGSESVGVEVKDPKGRPIEGARVMLTFSGPSGGVGPPLVATDSRGRAVVNGLVLGQWQIEIRHPDFLSYVGMLHMRPGKKAAVSTSFLEAAGTSLTPVKVKFFNAKNATASAPLPDPRPELPQLAAASSPSVEPEQEDDESSPPVTAQVAEPPPPVVQADRPPTTVTPPVGTYEREDDETSESTADADSAPAAAPVPSETRTAEVEVAAAPAVVPVTEPPVSQPVSTPAAAAPEPVSDRETEPSIESLPETLEEEAVELPDPAVEPEPVQEAESATVFATEPTAPVEVAREPAPTAPFEEPESTELTTGSAATSEDGGTATVIEPAAEAVIADEPMQSPPPLAEAPVPDEVPPLEPDIVSDTTQEAAPSLPQEIEPEETLEPEVPTIETPDSTAPEPAAEVIPDTESAAPTAIETIESDAPPAIVESEAEPTEPQVSEPPSEAPTIPTTGPTTPPSEIIPAPAAAVVAMGSYRDGSCPDCEAGEWASANSKLVGVGQAGCDASLVETARKALQGVGDSINLELAGYLGPLYSPSAKDAVEILEGNIAQGLQAELRPHLDGSSSCQIVALVVPKAVRYTKSRYFAADRDSSRECSPGADCGLGQARWVTGAQVEKGYSTTVIWAIFENGSGDRQRRATLSVYFRPPHANWAPRTIGGQ